jgi:type I restriction enzyme M protein
VQENDIGDIVQRFHSREEEVERKRTEQSFLVPVDEIRENDYDLSINKYKEIEYEPVHYDPPGVILDRIDGLEKEIQGNMVELRKMLGTNLDL